jgi:hypothetical protein
MIANPLKAARDGLRGRHGAGAMRGENFGHSFSHAPPRSKSAFDPNNGLVVA